MTFGGSSIGSRPIGGGSTEGAGSGSTAALTPGILVYAGVRDFSFVIPARDMSFLAVSRWDTWIQDLVVPGVGVEVGGFPVGDTTVGG